VCVCVVCLSHVASGTLGAVMQVDLGLLQALAALVACEHHHLIEVALQACVRVRPVCRASPPLQNDGRIVSHAVSMVLASHRTKNPLTTVRV
jgi:hypothetical protein